MKKRKKAIDIAKEKNQTIDVEKEIIDHLSEALWILKRLRSRLQEGTQMSVGSGEEAQSKVPEEARMSVANEKEDAEEEIETKVNTW